MLYVLVSGRKIQVLPFFASMNPLLQVGHDCHKFEPLIVLKETRFGIIPSQAFGQKY